MPDTQALYDNLANSSQWLSKASNTEVKRCIRILKGLDNIHYIVYSKQVVKLERNNKDPDYVKVSFDDGTCEQIALEYFFADFFLKRTGPGEKDMYLIEVIQKGLLGNERRTQKRKQKKQGKEEHTKVEKPETRKKGKRGKKGVRGPREHHKKGFPPSKRAVREEATTSIVVVSPQVKKQPIPQIVTWGAIHD